MVTGFEQYTYELTKYEQETLLPLIIKCWEKKELEEKVQMATMIIGMNKWIDKLNESRKEGSKKSQKVNGPRMRKLIHYIRVMEIIPNLVANSKGYYKTNKVEELQKFINSCSERANSFEQIRLAMIRQRNKIQES